MKQLKEFINEGIFKKQTGLEKIINVYNAKDTYGKLNEKGKSAFSILANVLTVANLYPERINEYNNELLAFLDIINITLQAAGYDELKKLTSKFEQLNEVDMNDYDKRFNKSIGVL